MNLTEHGIMEIEYLHLEDKEKETYLKKFIKEFLKIFREQGHSNNSAPFAINGFKHYTENKTFIDKDLKDIIDKPEESNEEDPNTWMSNDIYELVSKYHELVNTEEFIVYDIKEDWLLNILYRLMDWKPITPLQGTPDEWKQTGCWDGEKENIYYQNKRYSSIFADDDHGKNAYNINGKVFCRNGIWFSGSGSSVSISFPYEVKEREKVYLEDYIKFEDAPIYYIKFKYLDSTEDLGEFTVGYLKSTLDTSISNKKFYKADFCILSRYISNNDEKWIDQETYEDTPIYYVRMIARLKEYLRNELKRRSNVILGIYEDKECTIKANL